GGDETGRCRVGRLRRGNPDHGRPRLRALRDVRRGPAADRAVPRGGPGGDAAVVPRAERRLAAGGARRRQAVAMAPPTGGPSRPARRTAAAPGSAAGRRGGGRRTAAGGVTGTGRRPLVPRFGPGYVGGS